MPETYTFSEEFITLTNDKDRCYEELSSVEVEYLDGFKKKFENYSWSLFGPGIIKNTPVKNVKIVYSEGS